MRPTSATCPASPPGCPACHDGGVPDEATIAAKLAAMVGLSDVAWVVAARDLFAGWRPTLAEATRLIGMRSGEPTGGIALAPMDARFDRAFAYGRTAGDPAAVPVRLISFNGANFSVRPADIVGKLPLFKADYNTYDGGRFFFFHPLLPNPGVLSGIQLYATDEDDRGESGMESICHVVDFQFGALLSRYRDGFSCEDPDIAFERFVRRWFTALAEHRDAEAVAMITAPNSYGITWTPVSVRAAIDRHGARDVTPPDTATGEPHSSLVALADGSGWSFAHDVPLDGAWSDLTAQFEFLRHGSDFAVVLHDLHVL